LSVSPSFILSRKFLLMKFERFTPYLLILPTVLYLVLFFAYPMVSALRLSVQSSTRYLDVLAEPEEGAAVVGTLAMQTTFIITDRIRGEEELASGRTRPIYWFEIEATDVTGEPVTGWTSQSDVFVESRTESTSGRVVGGTPVQEWTLDHLRTMFNHPNFWPAIRNTLLLIVIILPFQFILAIVMALVLQARIKGGNTFLYIYAIPLGISDLAAGLVWYSIFTQRGFINSFLISLGLIERPVIFIASDTFWWMVLAIVLAEIWRATSIVMVIVVSGLQAIPDDYLEAGELFGASLWQRIRYIILPILKPSLQVALILRTILAFQVFAVVIALTGGRVFTVLANETYRWYDRGAAGYNNPHVASAYAMLIMVISLGISFFYLRTLRTQEEALAG
jgi:multiple sugar transport system permease protein